MGDISREAMLLSTHDAGWLLFAGAIFFLTGMILLGLGFFFLSRSRASVKRLTARATGTVIGLVERGGMGLAGSGARSYSGFAPTVRFRAQLGEEIEFTSSVSSSPPAYHVGQEVNVLYNPLQPQKAIIGSSRFLQFWFAPTMLLGMGVLFSLIGIGILYAALSSF